MGSRNNQTAILEPLPGSENRKFWGKDADIHTGLPWQSMQEVERVTQESLGEHYFIRKSGHQAECRHCGWGFQLDPGDKIVDGHLYNKEKELVI